SQMSMLLITHDLGIVSEIADDVCVMYAGQVVEQSSVHDIFASPQHPYTQRLLKALPHQVKKGEKLEAIPGMVAHPRYRPQGCSFHPRCLERKSHCMDQDPELVQIAPRHGVRCWERK
ncbi:MAG: ABC transporter ATP-binding protein, partial [Chlamydiota bacterium]|nr:ABC transporter ATP-binding protein [Chlamydiota bacterium]